MTERPHHIRLIAGFEIEPGQPGRRLIEREAGERLAAALAEDLARVVPEASDAMLVLGASLFEPAELIRPGLAAFGALEDLARPVTRDHGTRGQLLSIGASGGRMPDARLRPPDQPPAGHFLALPLLLIADQTAAAALTPKLESELFERGGIDPPARAMLAEVAGFDSVHGQLLTLADLIALQQVQLDTAGLGGFWPVIEQAVLSAETDSSFELPGGLTARYRATERDVGIDFLSFDQHARGPADYALWTRAFRSLAALLDAHGIAWQTRVKPPLTHDTEQDCLIETIGPIDWVEGVTEQVDDDSGLVAWSVVEDHRLYHIYPLSSTAMRRVRADLAARSLPLQRSPAGLAHDPESNQLKPSHQP